jgi:glycosyltransferase involved in cell wall biosynthesis
MSRSLIRSYRLEPDADPTRRVLFVTNMWPDETRPYYGSFIASQARSLREAGCRVDVVYVRGFLGPRAYALALARLPGLAARGEHEVVHVHYGHTALAGIGIRRRPTVVSFCGEDLLGAPRDGGLTRKSRAEVAVFRQLSRLATVTITKSREMEERLPAAIAARNVVLPNGVDLNQFAPGDRDLARRQLGWEPDEKVLLFLGNPEDPRKNFELAEATAGLVREWVPEARLQVGWKLEPSQVPTVMNAADCLLFSSRSEGSPNAVKEAMACALPVVATPVGDIAERLRGVDNCYVCSPTAGDFAGAALAALRGGRAPAARDAVADLSLQRVADRLLSVYDTATRLGG